MGISGLLPLLKDIQSNTHVSEYAGKTIGIDVYVWLHRGVYGCAREIVKQQPTTRYISYAIGRIRMLQHFGIKPYIVFDGGNLPAKQVTEDERHQRRQENLSRANQLEREGKMSEARDVYAKCVDVTPEMAFQLIKVLRAEAIPYVVAPYEADAQLAFLEQKGIIDAIITEDSDLLVFGCNRVLFKLDQAGACVEILRERFAATRQLVLSGWTGVEFRQMAILSGCDYLPSIVGMGLKNAHRLLRRYKTVDKVLQAIRLEGKWKVPPGYALEFRKAELTFVHQRVWDPQSNTITTLTPLPAGTTDDMLPFIGAPMDDQLAAKIASGDVDPVTFLPIADRFHSSCAERHSLQRSATAPNFGSSPAAIAGPSRTLAPSRTLTSFYRPQSSPSALQGAKKTNTKEAGQQTIKRFFNTQTMAKPVASASTLIDCSKQLVDGENNHRNSNSDGGQGSKANSELVSQSSTETTTNITSSKGLQGNSHSNQGRTVGIRTALQERDVNRIHSMFGASGSAGTLKPKANSSTAIFQLQELEEEKQVIGLTDSQPVRSRFFGKSNVEPKPISSEQPAAIHPYLELKQRDPTSCVSSSPPPAAWDGCQDLPESTLALTYLAAATLGITKPSSPFVTTQDEFPDIDAETEVDADADGSIPTSLVVVCATPPRSRKRSRSPFATDDGVISSPESLRSSSLVATKNEVDDDEEEDEDDAKLEEENDPERRVDLDDDEIRSVVRSSSPSPHASSDPIEIDPPTATTAGISIADRFGLAAFRYTTPAKRSRQSLPSEFTKSTSNFSSSSSSLTFSSSSQSTLHVRNRLDFTDKIPVPPSPSNRRRSLLSSSSSSKPFTATDTSIPTTESRSTTSSFSLSSSTSTGLLDKFRYQGSPSCR